MKIVFIILLSLIISTKSYSKNVSNVMWSNDSVNAYTSYDSFPCALGLLIFPHKDSSQNFGPVRRTNHTKQRN